MKHSHRRGFLFALFLFALSALSTIAADTAQPAQIGTPMGKPPGAVAEGVPVVVWGRTLVSYRLGMEFVDATQRARAAEERITNALGIIKAEDLVVHPMQIGDVRGFSISAGQVFLLKVMSGDLNPEENLALEKVAEGVVTEIRSLIRDHAAQHSVSLLIRASAHSLLATVLFAAFWVLSVWLKARLLLRIAKSTERAGQMFNAFGYDWRPVFLGIATTLTRLLMLAVVLSCAYLWVTFVLSQFPYTRHWGEQLGSYLFDTVSTLASGAIREIPNLIVLLVIYLAARGLIRILNGWFSAVESGKYLSTWLDVEAARATRRLAYIGVWIVALVVAFPYLPGARSEAFKGISVFLGLMLSLGGAGFVSQIIGGLAAVYSRAVRSGDYIIVGETQGTVKELGLLTTKVVTRTREEVTIPNAMLIGSAIRNFSRGAGNSTLLSTGVTIGYDAPWRQVQAMLLQAAVTTEGVLRMPSAYVLQTALDDFYVRYELTVCVKSALERSEVMDRLHGKIQDIFNENGVQIMSPHFLNQPSAAVVVPKNLWHVPPAKPPA